jgi:hypothetical protein
MPKMNIGTKSLLFGAHQFIIHPYYVLKAWIKLYHEWPTWRELVCIIIHDWGYWGMPNMDGKEGETHPMWAARFALFHIDSGLSTYHWKLCLYHSRFYAKASGADPSKLCMADKLSICLMPAWLYLPLVRMTGEIKEYMLLLDTKYSDMMVSAESEIDWFNTMRVYLINWIKDNEKLVRSMC